MLKSVNERERELQKAIDEVKYLSEALRRKIELERLQPEEYPVIKPPKELESGTLINDENDMLAAVSNPTTPPKINRSGSSSPGELLLSHSADSTVVELGDPGTSFQNSNALVLHSPARSCPTLSDADRPHLDGPATGLPCYRINSDDDLLYTC